MTKNQRYAAGSVDVNADAAVGWAERLQVDGSDFVIMYAVTARALPAPAAWVTVTDWPATVTVPERWDWAVLALTDSVTVPLPDPLDPDEIVIQETPDDAVHAQPDVVDTVSDRLAPLDEMEGEAGVTE